MKERIPLSVNIVNMHLLKNLAKLSFANVPWNSIIHCVHLSPPNRAADGYSP